MSRKIKTEPVPAWAVYEGSCIEQLSTAVGRARADLIVADPPYNFGMPYSACDDNKSYDEYMAWTGEWLAAAVSALARHGALWVFAPAEWVSEIDVLAKHTHKLTKRRHVVWCFTFGQAAQKNFTRSSCHLLYYTKAKTKFTFNADAVRVPSARQLVYNDGRALGKGKLPDDTWMLLREQLEPCMTPDRDTWLESRICGTYRERQPHSPNQIPVPLMERIVLATSDPGDAVVDLFAGTGSLGVAAVRHGRDYQGFDVSKVCVHEARKRIEDELSGVSA